MKYLVIFIITIFIILSNIVMADSMLEILFFPLAIIIGFFITVLYNFLIFYIPIRFFYNKRIENKSHFFIFILKFSFIIELISWIISSINNSAIYYVSSGIIIFSIFRYFFPKELKMNKKQIIVCSIFMSILSNPLITEQIFYYLFYSLSFAI